MRQHLFSAALTCGRAFREDGSFPNSLSNKITKFSLVQGMVNIKLVFGISDLGINFGKYTHWKDMILRNLTFTLLLEILQQSLYCVDEFYSCCFGASALRHNHCIPGHLLDGWQKIHHSHGQNSISLLPEGFIINQIIVFQTLASRLLIWDWILFSLAFLDRFFLSRGTGVTLEYDSKLVFICIFKQTKPLKLLKTDSSWNGKNPPVSCVLCVVPSAAVTCWQGGSYWKTMAVGWSQMLLAPDTVRGLSNTSEPTKGRGSTEKETAKKGEGRKQLLTSLSA